MKALQNKDDYTIQPQDDAIGTPRAYTGSSAETPQQKDMNPMAWFSKATDSGNTLSQHNGGSHANAAAPVAHAADESTANPIIARAFALGADWTEAY